MMTLTAYRIKKNLKWIAQKGMLCPGEAVYDKGYANGNAGRGFKQGISE